MWVSGCMGFSSGLPFALTGATMQAWLKDSRIDLAWIGYLSAVTLPYTLKFVWAPVFDHFRMPFLGRRRGWLAAIQLALAAAIAAMAFASPSAHLRYLVAAACAVAFLSASQDILVDAYRREIFPERELGLGLSYYSAGYRVAQILSGGMALILADRISWKAAYLTIAAFMCVGLLTTLFCKEPRAHAPPPLSLRASVFEPFREYFRRAGAAWTIAFAALYNAGQCLAVAMTMSLYLDIGFTKSEIGEVVKGFGVAAAVAGVFAGGAVLLKLGIRRSLLMFGLLQGAALLGFAGLFRCGHSLVALNAAVAIENFTAGMATAAFMSYLASLTDKRYTATQYALLSSLAAASQVALAIPAGVIAKALGWGLFFVLCALMTLPGIVILRRLKISDGNLRSIAEPLLEKSV